MTRLTEAEIAQFKRPIERTPPMPVNLPIGVDDAMVKRALRGALNRYLDNDSSPATWDYESMVAALTAALGDTHCVVPKIPTEDMCNAMECAWGTEEMWAAGIYAASSSGEGGKNG